MVTALFVGGIVFSWGCVMLFILVIPMFLIDSTDQCIKSWTAPRVLLIEKLNELRK